MGTNTTGVEYRAFILLERLLMKHGPTEFGRICQVLLALTLKERGFQVPYCQLAGRPDIVATRNTDGYRIEVKAYTKSEVTIGEKDLDGVIDSSRYQPIIAVLSFPEARTRWIMANARRLEAGRFNKSMLKTYSIRTLEKEVNKIFGNIVEKYYENAIMGSRSLKHVFDGV